MVHRFTPYNEMVGKNARLLGGISQNDLPKEGLRNERERGFRRRWLHAKKRGKVGSLVSWSI
jgi:hypothetical protein